MSKSQHIKDLETQVAILEAQRDRVKDAILEIQIRSLRVFKYNYTPANVKKLMMYIIQELQRVTNVYDRYYIEENNG